MKTDLFDQKLVEDIILQKLHVKPTDQMMFANMMSQCLSKIVVVLERQYDISNWTSQRNFRRNQSPPDAATSMLRRWWACSQLSRTMPPTQLCFLSSKIRAQKNKAGEYLDYLDQEKREKIVKFAVPLGRWNAKSLARSKRKFNSGSLQKCRKTDLW